MTFQFQNSSFDYQSPDYTEIFRQRIDALKRIRGNPDCLPQLRNFYRENIAQFISDWGVTYDPRTIAKGLPAIMPFILFPRQVELVNKIIEKWKAGEPLLIDKSRETGVTWLAISTACSLCIFYEDMAIGFGSRKEEYVDKVGAPKCIFYKGRVFMRNLPAEFRGSWDENTDAPHLRMNFKDTRSNISGEAGDNIGRGDRTAIYFVDEAAYLEHPDLVEASLSQTTNCRVDIGTPNGTGNVFAQKRFGGKVEVFTLHWKQDPRKDDAWYQKQLRELDPVIVAQEIDIDYSASAEGVVIPASWARAAVDAHIKLRVAVSGAHTGALDVADEGRDKCAYAGGQGILVDVLQQWSGRDSDTFYTAQRAVEISLDEGHEYFKYDADGLGAFVRGDVRVINEQRAAKGLPPVKIVAFRGSGAVVDPTDQDVQGRKNEDYFLNFKAQAYWRLRKRFNVTWRAVVKGEAFDPNEIISISSELELHQQLLAELSQPTYKQNAIGKIVIDKLGEGIVSPNLADSVNMKFAPSTTPILVSAAAVARARSVVAGRRRYR